MNIILFGAPGSGKGTQSSLLIEKDSMNQISTGDLLREAISKSTVLGIQAKSFMDKGELVPDSLVIGLVEEFLKTKNGPFILDGFPRNVDQAVELDKLSKSLGVIFEKAIFLEVPTDVLVKRLTGRRVCSGCKSVFSIHSSDFDMSAPCIKCGGALEQRKDDRLDVVKNRLDVYNQYTSPLKEYYLRLNKLTVIDGNLSTEEVYAAVKSAIR